MGFVDVFYAVGVLIRRVPEDLKMVSLLGCRILVNGSYPIIMIMSPLIILHDGKAFVGQVICNKNEAVYQYFSPST